MTIHSNSNSKERIDFLKEKTEISLVISIILVFVVFSGISYNLIMYVLQTRPPPTILVHSA